MKRKDMLYVCMHACTPMIKQKILDKRRLWKQWQNTRAPQVKAKLNKAVKELKHLLNDEKRKAIQEYLESLTASEATKRLKQPQTSIPPLRSKEGEWAKSDMQKANVLAEHFANVFKPYTSEMSEEEEQEILHALETPAQLETLIKNFKLNEVRAAINQLHSKKPQGIILSSEEF